MTASRGDAEVTTMTMLTPDHEQVLRDLARERERANRLEEAVKSKDAAVRRMLRDVEAAREMSTHACAARDAAREEADRVRNALVERERAWSRDREVLERKLDEAHGETRAVEARERALLAGNDPRVADAQRTIRSLTETVRSLREGGVAGVVRRVTRSTRAKKAGAR